MITEQELAILNTAYESGRRTRFAVDRDEAWIDRSETNFMAIDVSVPLPTISKFLKMNVIEESGSSPDNAITYYTMTSRAFQVMNNPETIHQLTTALFF